MTANSAVALLEGLPCLGYYSVWPMVAFKVNVTDARISWGNKEYWIEPFEGVGGKWVKQNLRIDWKNEGPHTAVKI